MQVHPGGSIIDFYAGSDGTEAWREFHARSDKASKWLEKLPSVPVQVNRDAVVADFAELREQLEKVRMSTSCD